MKGQVMPVAPGKEFFVLGVFLGPILEESVFRGCFLPVLGGTLPNAISVIVTAILFAAFHAPSDITHWVWFSATGLAYGWLRVASATTTASAMMHASCNLTLVLTPVIG
jgi:membrane protease YdiL (CAAX protease family)